MWFALSEICEIEQIWHDVLAESFGLVQGKDGTGILASKMFCLYSGRACFLLFRLLEGTARVRLQTFHLSFSGSGATAGGSGLGVLYLHVCLICFRGNSAPVVSSPGLVMTLQSSDLLHWAKIHGAVEP